MNGYPVFGSVSYLYPMRNCLLEYAVEMNNLIRLEMKGSIG